MNKLLFILSILFVTSFNGTAQNVYSTTNGELIFSFANAEYDGVKANDKLRFSPIINVYKYWHYDISTNVGFMAGIGSHNVGFITEVPTSVVDANSGLGYTGDVTKRFRNYSLGIPIGVKIGLMEQLYIYGGYEIEFPYLYKEKTYEDGEKVRKYTSWFSDQSPAFYNTVFVGVQMPRGFNVKFHYYMSDFFDQSYVQQDNWTGAQNFYPTKANMFYFSISKTIFKGKEFMNNDKPAQAHTTSRVAMR